MLLPPILSPTGDNELLSLCRVYMVLTTGGLLTGHSFVAAGASMLAVYTLMQDSSSYGSFASTRRLDATLLDRWFVLCTISFLVAVVSWFLISASTMQGDATQAYKTYFFGFTLQKSWAIVIGFILLEEFRQVLGLFAPALFQQDKKSNEKANKKSKDAPKKSDRPLLNRPSSVLALVWHELRVRIIQGRNLTPMDHAFVFFGRMVTSDPYVQVLLGQKSFGNTPFIPKTLNPVWPKNGSTFRMAVLPKSLEVYQTIECRIYDYDTSSQDDAMGTVHVPIPTKRNKPVRGWYSVGKGKGENYCKGATGELYVEVEIICP